MESPPGQNEPDLDASSIRARLPPALSATSDLVLVAKFKARMEEIELQRDEESAAMSNRLHALVRDYKRRDQLFVDRYTECLEQLSRLPSVPNTHPCAKPCRGVVDREIFGDAGVIVRFYPDPSPLFSHGDTTDEETDPLKPSHTATTNNHRTPSEAPSFSPLSSIRYSPAPTPKRVPSPSVARPRKRPKRSPSPDELALDSSSSPSVGSAAQKTNGSLSRTPQQVSSRKPLPTDGRRKQTTQPTSTPAMTANTITITTAPPPPPPPPRESSSPLSSASSSSSAPPTPGPGPRTKPTPIPVPVPVINPSSASASALASSSITNRKPASTAKKAKAANRGGPPAPLPCLECRRRKVRCSRARPRCERCERTGWACAYPDA
ncbi:uncharacterized protein B0H64DRAFT_398276 [Chaetomium fimeti]|uniref:Zn(2)-C6 fungal-type domain-containing protein n=1 Tax=Chaetomium fimeti TaxID=1854472 RepID=A0AAE0HHB0_9PEZI|nr:hypothetical protein B0H64DRAFT_398276 [Chaetomium fimeti]